MLCTECVRVEFFSCYVIRMSKNLHQELGGFYRELLDELVLELVHGMEMYASSN